MRSLLFQRNNLCRWQRRPQVRPDLRGLVFGSAIGGWLQQQVQAKLGGLCSLPLVAQQRRQGEHRIQLPRERVCLYG